MKNNILTISLTLITIALSAQAPEGYYNGTENLTGQELKKRLHQITRGHKVRMYSEFRDVILPDLDEDPGNSNNIILFYKNASIPKSDFASNNQPDFWNREHTWPKSHGFPNEGDTAYTDVHHLRPSDATVNSSKSNKDFNNVPHTEEYEEGEAPDTYTDTNFFEPRDNIKGDVARMLFYMDMRYESETLDLVLVDRFTYTGDPELGVLYTLLEWHELDPVDQYEIDRHDKAYGYQDNRNPFIDHPEWVEKIWGSTTEPYMSVDQLGFSGDFGTILTDQSLTQTYVVHANNLESDITITVGSPFYLSTNDEDYSNQITLTHVASESDEVFDVYLKFAPQSGEDISYVATVTHQSANAIDLEFEVTGKEGEVVILDIAEARELSLGSIVTVSGVVIDAGNNNDDNRIIYDGTGGLVVRSFGDGNESDQLVLGDSVVVTGGLSTYNGLLQIELPPITIQLIKQGATLPEPQLLTLLEIGEEHESELVKVQNVGFVGVGNTFQGGGSVGNFLIFDGTSTLTFRIGSDKHPLVGTTVPAGTFELTGIVGEFSGDYQISPRTLDDLVLIPEVLNSTLKPEVEVYPNPATRQVTIHTRDALVIRLVTVDGKELRNEKISSNTSIDVNHLESGLYLLYVQSNSGRQLYKLIKK